MKLSGFLASLKVEKKIHYYTHESVLEVVQQAFNNYSQLSSDDFLINGISLKNCVEDVSEKLPENYKNYIIHHMSVLTSLCMALNERNLGEMDDYEDLGDLDRKIFQIIEVFILRRVADYLEPYNQDDLSNEFISTILDTVDYNVCFILSETYEIAKKPYVSDAEARPIFQCCTEKLASYVDSIGISNSHSLYDADYNDDKPHLHESRAKKLQEELNFLLKNEGCSLAGFYFDSDDEF